MQELGGLDLGQPDRAHVADVLAERAVHLLVDALGLDRDVVEVRLAQHRALALVGTRSPTPVAVRQVALAGGLDEQLERRLGVGDDAVVGREHPPDLGRLDVDVDERAARGVGRRAPPVWRLAQRLPIPSTKSAASIVALP